MTRIPNELWSSYVDPAEPASLNDNGQWSAVGELWQAGQTGIGYMVGRYPELAVPGGFGVILNADGSIHNSWAYGSTMRQEIRPSPSLPNGLPVLHARMVWTNHPDYNPRGQIGNGVNLSVPWPYGGDRLAWDANRIGKSAIADDQDDPLAIWASDDGTGDQVFLCHVIQIKRWMLGNHLGAGAGSIHAHWSPRSPFTIMFGAGKMWVVTRTTTDPIVDQQPPDHIAGTIAITEDDIDKFWVIAHDVRIDPHHGHLKTLVKPGHDRDWTVVADQRNGLGYGYAPGDPRARLFYLRLASMTRWHNDQKRALNNWEGPPVQDVAYAWSGGIINPGNQGLTFAQVLEHGDTFITTPNPPPPPPVDDSTKERLTNLEDRVEALAAETAHMRAAWSATAGFALDMVDDG